MAVAKVAIQMSDWVFKMCNSVEEDIMWLVDNGYAQDLLDMLFGETEFGCEESFKSMDSHSRILRSNTISYLEFILGKSDSRNYNSCGSNYLKTEYAKYFEAWKLALCPGISTTLLGTLVEAKAKEGSSN